MLFIFFFQAEDGIRDIGVTGVQTCALPISSCGMWDAASAWFDEQCHVHAQDLNQRNTGPPAAECANLTTLPWGQALEGYYCHVHQVDHRAQKAEADRKSVV